MQRPFYYMTLGADPTNADVVYGGAEGFYKSTDGGKTMTPMRTPHGDNHDIWINPRDGNTMIQSNDGGANVSFDGGAHVVDADEPADVGDLRRLDGRRVSVPHLRRAAGRDDGHPDRRSPTRTRAATGAAGRGARRGRSCRTRRIRNMVYGACKGQFGR